MGPSPSPRLLDILILLTQTELFLYDVLILTIFVIIAILIVLIVVFIIAIIIVLCYILLTRCLIILIHDSDLVVRILKFIAIKGVLPNPGTMIVIISGDIHLLLFALMMVFSSLPASLMGLSCVLCLDVGLSDQQILLAQHAAQILRLRLLLAHLRLMIVGLLVALLAGPRLPLRLVLGPLRAVATMMRPIASLTTGAHLLTRTVVLPRLLLTIVELVADPVIVLPRVDHLLKTIVVSIHFDSVRDDGLDAVVVAHHLHGAYDAKERNVLAPRCL